MTPLIEHSQRDKMMVMKYRRVVTRGLDYGMLRRNTREFLCGNGRVLHPDCGNGYV